MLIHHPFILQYYKLISNLFSKRIYRCTEEIVYNNCKIVSNLFHFILLNVFLELNTNFMRRC